METTLTYLVGFIFIAIAAKQVGKFFSRYNLPYITGYLLAGMLAGPFVLDFLPTEATEDLRFIDELSLAVIAFVAGSELYLKELQGRYKTIAWNTIGIFLAAFIIGGIVIFALTEVIPFTSDMPTESRVAVAVLGSTVLLALSPASTIAVIKEVRAKGPFTKTILSVTVSMDVVIIVLFAVSASIAAALLNNTSFNLVFAGLLVLDLSVAIIAGYVIGKGLERILATGWDHRLKTALILLIGMTIFAVAFEIAHYTKDNAPAEIHIEPLLVAMIAGFLITNFTNHRDEFADILHEVSPFVYVAFFTLTGIALKLDVLLETLPIALLLFGVRVVSIFIGSYAGGTLSGEPKAFNRISWMAFITQAGIALGLAREVAVEFPALGDEFATMIISVIVLNEIFGPMFLKAALSRAGETNLPEELGRGEGRAAVILGIESQSLALARRLNKHHWRVIIADPDQAQVERLAAEDVDERHIPDISIDTLRPLLSGSSDTLVAMLNEDQQNWRACEIAYHEFGIRRLVVRVNDLSCAEKFRELGAVVVDAATGMVNLLDQFVRAPQSAILIMEPEQEMMQVTVSDPDMHGRLVRDLRLPNDVLLMGIKRNGTAIVPHGYNKIQLNDEVTLLGCPESIDTVAQKLGY